MKELPVIKVQLVHIQGPLKGQIQEFTDPTITVGRNPSCLVQFPTDLTTISRNHAELVREGNRYKIVDRSTNGTFVNGKRVTEAFLKDGDVIMFTEGGPKVSYLAAITEAIQAEPVSVPPAPEPAPPVRAVPVEPSGVPVSPVPPPMPVEADRPVMPPVQPTAPVAPEPPMAQVQEPARPAAESRQTVQKTQTPLIVQFGPMLKSYRELPIVIGKKADCDFVLDHPSLADHHAQIFFSQDTYWVRDLTGRSLVAVGGKPIGFDAPLKTQDILSLAPAGPALRFLGEGRLAEYEENPIEAVPPTAPVSPDRPGPAKKGKTTKSIFDIFKK